MDVVRDLTDPLDLVGEWHGESLRVSTADELRPEAVRDHRSATARRALRDAVAHYSGHPLAPAAYLVLGNLHCENLELPQAISWYERLLREMPRSRLGVEANYNLALIHQRLGNSAAARQAYYRVVDAGPAHPLAPLAFVRLGHMYLEEGELRKAISVLRRADTLADEPHTRGVAALTLAAAYAVTDEPQAAVTLLQKRREFLQQEPFRQGALFLNAYAEYRTAVLRRQFRREANELLAALLQLRQDLPLRGFGILLVGRAYHDLGLWEQVVQTYRRALPGMKGPLLQEINLGLAEALAKVSQFDEATRLYESVIESGSPLGPLAILRLAEIDLQADRLTQCLERCRTVLRHPDSVSSAAVMTLMGQAYDKQGDHRRAAECFAGRNPE
jgi:tetratricopeptide (TPR) repeat protein